MSKHTYTRQTYNHKLFLTIASIAVMSLLSNGAHAEARGCKKGDVLYHFGFSDWKSQGTGWKAREADFSGDKKGLSVFVNLSDQQATTMNDARSLAIQDKSILLRVSCDPLPKQIVLAKDPTNQTDWTQAGGANHALLQGPNKGYDADKFNKDFQHLLIKNSSQWKKSQ